MFSASVRYNYSSTTRFVGKINYFLSGGGETYWMYYPGGVKTGDGTCSIHGPGFNVGIIYFLSRK